MKINSQEIGLEQPLLLIAGPCVIESEAFTLNAAAAIKEIVDNFPVNFCLNLHWIKPIVLLLIHFAGLVSMKA